MFDEDKFKIQANLNNITNTTIKNERYINDFTIFDKIVGHFYLFIIFSALFGNICSFIIFQTDNQMRKLSSMVILRYVVIFDTFSLFTWNLNYYLKPNFQVEIEELNIVTCRIFLFIQYMSLQSSSFMRALVTIDRLVCILKTPGSFVSHLPFTTSRASHFWSILIIFFTICLNFHLLIYAGVYKTLGRKNARNVNKVNESISFECYEHESGLFFKTYDIVNMVVYSVLPSLVMIVFNILLYKKTLKSISFKPQNSIAQRTALKKRKTTFNLLVITTAFVITTLPATIYFALFYSIIDFFQYGRYFEYIVSSLEFSNHASVFVIFYLTNKRFAQIVREFFSIV